MPETSEASPDAGNVGKDSRRHIGGIFASQPGSRKCWKDSWNVEKTYKDNPTASTKASPEAENVERTQEDWFMRDTGGILKS